ncbi:MAG: hypothetical protein J5662_07150 [Clostridia bacterium]|nr:hypothetical protein [Clostridia bacterium]
MKQGNTKMAKYINAKDLKNEFSHYVHCEKESEGLTLVEINEVVDRLPSADVVEVKHGKWIRTNPLTDTLECSLCGLQVPVLELCSPYCPLCGADMRGKNE